MSDGSKGSGGGIVALPSVSAQLLLYASDFHLVLSFVRGVYLGVFMVVSRLPYPYNRVSLTIPIQSIFALIVAGCHMVLLPVNPLPGTTRHTDRPAETFL